MLFMTVSCRTGYEYINGYNCTPCEKNFFKDTAGSGVCKPCTDKDGRATLTIGKGATSDENDCVIGMYDRSI